MTDEKSDEKTPTEEELAAEAEAKVVRRQARKARIAELKVQIEAWEDRSLVVWHTLEQRKLDLIIMDEGPRQIFLRDESKRYLSEYTELKKLHLAGMREYAALEDEEAAEREAERRTLGALAPAIGGIFGGALANWIGKAVTKAGDTVAPPTEVSVEPAPVTQTSTAEAPALETTSAGDTQKP